MVELHNIVANLALQTAPATTVSAINDMAFDQVPWERVIKGEFDGGKNVDYVVDGSILAAKIVDASYSLFTLDQEITEGPGETFFKGIFLGAEKLWVGEAVRIRAQPKAVAVLIVNSIKLTTNQDATSTVIFSGNVLKLIQKQVPHGIMPTGYTEGLPPRLIRDLLYRNEAAGDVKSGLNYSWVLVEEGACMELSEIKGRWYETRTLLPILRGQQKFEEELALGRTMDVGELMNGRRDNNNVPEKRRKNRKDTLGRAVPDDFKPSRGLDGPEGDNLFPGEQSATSGASDLKSMAY